MCNTCYSAHYPFQSLGYGSVLCVQTYNVPLVRLLLKTWCAIWMICAPLCFLLKARLRITGGISYQGYPWQGNPAAMPLGSWISS